MCNTNAVCTKLFFLSFIVYYTLFVLQYLVQNYLIFGRINIYIFSPDTNMGFRQAAVLGPICFFLGVLFICFNIDHRVLWGGLSEDTVEDGFQFYTTFFNAPPAIKVRPERTKAGAR